MSKMDEKKAIEQQRIIIKKLGVLIAQSQLLGVAIDELKDEINRMGMLVAPPPEPDKAEA